MSCHADRKLPKDLTNYKFSTGEKGELRTELLPFMKQPQANVPLRQQQLAREAEVRQLKRIRHDSGLGGTSDQLDATGAA